MCSADSSTQSSDIPHDSCELFTVLGLSGREGEKDGGRWDAKSEGKTSSEGGVGTMIKRVEALSALICEELVYAIVCFGVARILRPPIITW